MIYLLLFTNFTLLILFIYQYKNNVQYKRDLNYTSKKLNDILAKNSNEKILVFTNDKALQRLLIEINELLNAYQKIGVLHLDTQNSMKKMISNISHDLKTPLTVILGYIETMTIYQNSHTEETLDYINKIHHKTKELVTFIDKFFDMSKIESGDFDIDISKIELNEVCRESILGFYDILDGSDTEIQIDIPDEPIYVMGNHEILDRILNNLISNAIRYGLDGNIMGLSLYLDGNYTYIEIWDKGKGIDELNIDHVFERLYTLEDSRNKAYQGSGLGLSITKRLVEELGGTITLESTPYIKTVFTVKLKRI